MLDDAITGICRLKAWFSSHGGSDRRRCCPRETLTGYRTAIIRSSGTIIADLYIYRGAILTMPSSPVLIAIFTSRPTDERFQNPRERESANNT